jgi:hypothetical protein
MTTMEQLEMLEQYNRKRIPDTNRWPLWPLLPLKNRLRQDPAIPGTPLCGLLTSNDVEAGKFIVRIGLIFFRYTAEEWAALPQEVYSSIDELLVAGWIGD